MSDPVIDVVEPDAVAESRYASRKFLVTLLVLAIGVGMTIADLLTPQLVELLKWASGLYFGFNVGQKAVEWISNALTPKEVK